MLVTFDDLASRLPVTLAVDEAARVEILLDDAEEIVRDAFSVSVGISMLRWLQRRGCGTPLSA